jgi:hypothetical protein
MTHRHDAYFALPRLNDAWAVGANEPGLVLVLQDALHLDLDMPIIMSHPDAMQEELSAPASGTQVLDAVRHGDLLKDIGLDCDGSMSCCKKKFGSAL